jgi:ADP-ribose pyrophosphatase
MTDTTKSTPRTDSRSFKREQCLKGLLPTRSRALRHELFDGGMSREINREVFVRHDAVCVYCPTTRSATRWCSSSSSAWAPWASTDTPWLVELVAGLIDKEGEQS